MELSLYGNPVAGQNGLGSSYRSYILQHLPQLRHLDLKRVTDHGQPISHQDPDGNFAPPTTRTASADGGQENRSGGHNGRSRNEVHEAMGTSVKGSRKPSGTSRSSGNGVSSSGSNGNEGNNDGFPVLLSHGSADTQSRGEHRPGSSSPGPQQRHRYQHQYSDGNDDPRGLHRTGPVMSTPAPDRGAIGGKGRVCGGAWEQVMLSCRFATYTVELVAADDHQHALGARRKQGQHRRTRHELSTVGGWVPQQLVRSEINVFTRLFTAVSYPTNKLVCNSRFFSWSLNWPYLQRDRAGNSVSWLRHDNV